ncbi:MAG TPA: phosphopantetheine-binding protein [Bryobacteraceae bacterium]|nr:phosphopantetheine-binding protein [Bryobacteraceae bacterium]
MSEPSVSPEVMDRVLRTLAETQKIPLDRVTPSATFEQLGIDSLDGINILFALENEFDINIPDESARLVRDVRQLAEGVQKLLAQKTEPVP